MKEGIGEDFGNQERISKLLRFATTKTEGEKQSVSFSEYVDRMKDGQDKIYFVTADTFNSAASSPHLEIFGEKDIEVYGLPTMHEVRKELKKISKPYSEVLSLDVINKYITYDFWNNIKH